MKTSTIELARANWKDNTFALFELDMTPEFLERLEAFRTAVEADMLRRIGEPVAKITVTEQYKFPLLEWLSADHSFREPIGTKLYSLEGIKK